MAESFASQVLLSIDSVSQGRKALEEVVSFNTTTTQAKTPVNTMNKRRVALGYRTSTKAVTWDIEVPIRTGDPEVDWEYLRDSNEEFLFNYQRDIDGKRRQLVDCVVNEIAESSSEDGTATLSISGMALDNRPGKS